MDHPNWLFHSGDIFREIDRHPVAAQNALLYIA